MAFRYPVPNEKQSEELRALGLNPREFVVTHQDEQCFYLKHYKSGNEVIFRSGIRSGISAAPNESQSRHLREVGLDPMDFIVTFQTEWGHHLRHHKSGRELQLCPNILKRWRESSGYQ